MTTEVIWLKSLATYLGLQLRLRPVIQCDNQGTASLATNPVYHARTKHIEINMHFIRDEVLQKELDIRFVHSIDQIAYLFTKPLSITRFFKLKANSR